ncbi:V-type H+-transporting ATPase subunit C [Cryptococcus wingfieldii CBS 7118]|uniref:V-type proton ATPase subunit C n=1 Tax=Cryptococcus wingfieldii CBS 7118 TaxID=1295528 RepID=A0A1E3I5X5_9TREE|nr:V-type H+-transporting ATPase subunit C [Cryptococcus wingfieldii CBS 7118]ODN83927.1 V-type H+-transporting ATPase subunit C [Cryptococcus wingfieldii CBS 7118]
MPSDLSYWLIAAPLKHGDPDIMLQDVRDEVSGVTVAKWEIPELKAGTLSNLLVLSDALPKLDAQFTNTVSKLLDQLRTLVSDDPSKLAQHARINELPVEEYLLGNGEGFKWDRSRWGQEGKVDEVVGALKKEIESIDAVQKTKYQSYQISKGKLTQIQRNQSANLSSRSLLGIVQKNHLVPDSEYLETLIFAVPKNSVKDWNEKYERLTSMVVPRSTQQITADDDYVLQTVTVFKKVRDEYIHKCRENKFIVREFTWDDSALEKLKQETADLEVEEKELWTDLLKLTRVNFSEAYQVLAHLKTINLFVESVLRYGLPADYAGVIIKPESKTAAKTLRTINESYANLALSSSSNSSAKKGKGKDKSSGGGAGEEVGGEFASVMEAEYYNMVFVELPMVVTR